MSLDLTKSQEVNADQQVPDHWSVVRVGEAGEVRVGRSRSPDRMSGPHQTPYLRAANIAPDGLDTSDLLEMEFTPTERDVYALQQDDVVLTEASGSPLQVGRSAVWTSQIDLCCYQNTVIRFRPELVSSNFAHLVFQHFALSGAFAQVARGVGIQHLGAGRFSKMLFPLPPRGEQDRIVEVAMRRLSNLEAAAKRLRSAADHLDAQIRAVIEVSVRGELIPSHSPSSLQLEDDSSSEGPLFHTADQAWFLPVGWKLTTVGASGDTRLGRQRAPRYEVGSHMTPYLRVANVFENRIDTSDVKEMNFEPDEQAIYMLQHGDVLLNEGQSPELVGRAAIFRGEVSHACFQNTLIRFRAETDVDPEFALLVFRYYLHTGIFKNIAKWSTNIAHLGLSRFRALPFPRPSLEEQRVIVAETQTRLGLIDTQRAHIERCLERIPVMRSEVLSAAVSGVLVPRSKSEGTGYELVEAHAHMARQRPQQANRSRTTKTAEVIAMADDINFEANPSPDLVEIIQREGGSMSTAELFRAAQYRADNPEHVESFYQKLRAELGQTIQTDHPHSVQAMIRVHNET